MNIRLSNYRLSPMNAAGATFFSLLFLASLLVGCLSVPHSVTVNRAEIRNATGAPILNVEALHKPNMKAGKVNQILPQNSFLLQFSEQPMKGKTSTLTWETRQGVRYRQDFVLPTEAKASNAGHPMCILYIITPGGRASVQLVDSKPGLF